MTLPTGNYGPTAAQYQRSSGPNYAEWYNQAKSTAVAVDNTPDDRDPRDGFIELGNSSSDGVVGRTLVQRWDNDKQAKVTFVSGTYHEESKGDISSSTQKDRYMEMESDSSRGLLLVRDRLTQNVDQHRGEYSQPLINDHRERTMAVSLQDGTVYAEGGDANLLFDSGWTIAEFRERKADLGV